MQKCNNNNNNNNLLRYFHIYTWHYLFNIYECKADGGGQENTEHCGRTIYTALVGRG